MAGNRLKTTVQGNPISIRTGTPIPTQTRIPTGIRTQTQTQTQTHSDSDIDTDADTDTDTDDDNSFISNRPDDSGELFRLGDGYDALTGERRDFCLDPKEVEVRASNINRAVDRVDIVTTHSELAKKLNLEVNAEASGVFKLFSGSASTKVSILKETAITSDSVLALAQYSYQTEQKEVYNTNPSLSSKHKGLLASDKLKFRRTCGDKYTNRVTLGATLYLVFKAERLIETSHSRQEIEAAMKIGFGKVFGLNASTNLTTTQKEILQSFSVSTRCYSEGGSPLICAEHQLEVGDISGNTSTVAQKIAAAKSKLANEIIEAEYPVAVAESSIPYMVPDDIDGRHWDVFTDYRPYLNTIQLWLDLEAEITKMCNDIYFYEQECEDGKELIAKNLENCALQYNWPYDTCTEPTAADLWDIRTADYGGVAVLYQHSGRSGAKLTLKFDDLFDPHSTGLRANKLYDLRQSPFYFNDTMTAYTAMIARGWKLILYEHPDGTGRRHEITRTHNLNVGDEFNDRASAFKLERE